MVASQSTGAPPILPRLQRLLGFRTFVKYVVLKDIKVRSRGTYLGVAWTLMNPAITIAVYYVVFRYVFRVAIPNYFAFFLIGFLPWVFFSRAITAAAGSIVDSEVLIKRAAFPLEVLPLSAVLYQLFHHAVAVAITLPVMLAFGGARPSLHLVWLVPLGAAFAVFTLGVSFWLATFGVFFRDTRDILEVTLPVLMWMTPILYTVEMLPAALRWLTTVNPLVPFIAALRTVLLDGQAPGTADVAGIVFWLVAVLGSGAWIFARYAPVFAEEV
jgi:ABC-type polysaccharide/polyol phosphate export permease